jgi:hypothetical protein
MIWVHKNRHQILLKSIKSDIEIWREVSIEMCQLRSQSYPKNIVDLTMFLDMALVDEMDSIRRLIICQLMLLNPHALVRQSGALLLSQDTSHYAGAVSCLQDLFPKGLYRRVKDILLNQKEINYTRPIKDLNIYFVHFILNAPKWVNPWMQTLALQCACMLKSRDAMAMIERALQSSDWLLLDTALWELGQMAPDKKTAQEIALTVPTQYLLQHEFQKLLEG